MTDSSGRIIVSDNAEVGVGLARPYLPVPRYPQFLPHTYSSNPDLGEASGYMSIDVQQLAGETVLWEGRASVSHPWVTIDGVWGWAIDQPNVTYRLKFNNTEVGSWTVHAGAVATRQGRFNVSAFTGQDWVGVQLTATASGTGVIACQSSAAT